LRNTIPGLPLWVDEGLVEHYSTFSVRDYEVRAGYAIPDHMIALRRREPLIPTFLGRRRWVATNIATLQLVCGECSCTSLRTLRRTL
jgi:hypothetical protein